ncbi:ferritin family protein [bacterium]|nr:ferritin family protein [bacterium]
MNFFNASEILQFAIRIEENGEKIYRRLSQNIDDSKLKEAFTYLADEEVKHKGTFQEMVSKIEKYQPRESYPGEYFAYLRAYANNIVFFPKKLEKELSQIKDVASAIDFGIRREVDSILYYLEMKNFTPESQHDVIHKVIDEERSHYLKLSELKKDYKE